MYVRSVPTFASVPATCSLSTDLTIDRCGSAIISVSTVLGSLTTSSVASFVPIAVAVLSRMPAVTSASVSTYVARNVAFSLGLSVMRSVWSFGASTTVMSLSPSSMSLTWTSVSVTLPSLVTVNVYISVAFSISSSPSIGRLLTVTRFLSTSFTIDRCGNGVSIVVSTSSSSLTGCPTSGVPVTDAPFTTLPFATSCCVTVYVALPLTVSFGDMTPSAVDASLLRSHSMFT